MNKIRLVFILLVVCKSSFCQDKFQSASNNAKFSLRISPTSLMDIVQPSFTFGCEYFLKNNQAVGIDYSILIDYQTTNNNNDVIEPHYGFILKPTYKFFFNNSQNGFIEFDCFWKKLHTPQTRWLERDVVNGVPTYYELENYTLEKDVLGLNFKVGAKNSFFNNLFFVETYIGVGFRSVYRKIAEHPNEVITVRTAFFGDAKTTNKYWGLSIPLGVRLVVPIK